ncbi:hypothetical protein [Brucella rhizosphaerae]|uniref:Putative papB protein n=1 Tax=Brucella rhizosphaerae TaxID=571254 RepID=A0A256FD61_9HYPH|nr:hypothetical protein [Brucella rhizosphaerae]OYR12807.1 putative papB protein [Brucella rhizosphaerae]
MQARLGIRYDTSIQNFTWTAGARIADLGNVDKDFGRAQLGAQLAVTEQVGLFSEINARFGHDDGNQIGYALGLQFRF